MDRNYIIKITRSAPRRSLSARRAWIEILSAVLTELLILVALRKESVDRNARASSLAIRSCVALRKESVDRNLPGGHLVDLGQVALRKESVDRNPIAAFLLMWYQCRSPQGERG